MRKLTTDALVIGGGSTGAGIIWDLALRGVRAILVEKGDLAHGTTGRYHGLLHSGGRYAVTDPVAARECIDENRILRRVIPHTIEDTGGYFVVTPWDPGDWTERWVEACRQCHIPVEEIPISQMLAEEPLLNPEIRRCFRVPDAGMDSFETVIALGEGAREYGATVLNYHKTVDLLTEQRKVVGARAHDLLQDEEVEIEAGVVINASGAWAGQIAGMAGISLQVLPAKGTMIAMNHRLVNTVVNRCCPPSDGDILVPVHTVAIIGTTNVDVPDPDRFPIEPWEVELLMDEGEKLVPSFTQARALRAWAGVRPLYTEEPGEADSRYVTRDYKVLDHAQHDGVAGLISVVGGKFTTYRLMAEKTADLACTYLGVSAPCRTAEEVVPASRGRQYHRLGARLKAIERDGHSGQLICECELVHRDQLDEFVQQTGTQNLDDVRRGLRLGMGPCQGTFCIYRAAGILHVSKNLPVAEANQSLNRFLQERWKGALPVLWGDQLKQAALADWLYHSVLCTDLLPEAGPLTSIEEGPGMPDFDM